DKSFSGVTVGPEDFLASRDVPDFEVTRLGFRMPRTPGSDAPAVGAERHAEDDSDVFAEGEVLPTRSGVPNPHGLVEADGGQALATGAEGHVPDLIGVTTEGESFLAGLRTHGSCVPDLRGPVPAGRGQAPAVRATGQPEKLMSIAAEGEHHL